MTKQEIRQEIRCLKVACPSVERAALSREVVANLLTDDRWKKARCVLLYHSLPDEVCTHELICHALDEGKRVLLPVVIGDDLELREYRDECTLTEGSFHIQEPTGVAFTDFNAIDLAIIPGVAFTVEGQRLGRGRGYYDRLLPHIASTYKIGLCWPFQLLPSLPTEPHDIRMDAVVSC